MSVSRRDFLKDMSVLAGAGLYLPSLWAAMKYDRKAVLDLFHVRAADTDARVKAGIEMNRKGPMLFTFKDKAGKIYENVHLKVTQKAHDQIWSRSFYARRDAQRGAQRGIQGPLCRGVQPGDMSVLLDGA